MNLTTKKQSYFLSLLIGTLFFSVLFFSCKKDNLVNELEVYKGRYTWDFTVKKDNWWSNSTTTKPATNWNYTAEVEFTNEGKLLFFINGEEIHKTGYTIVEQNVYNNGTTVSLVIDPHKEDSKKLDLNNEVSFTLTNDTLSIDDYPGNSYDEYNSGTHYFIRN